MTPEENRAVTEKMALVVLFDFPQDVDDRDDIVQRVTYLVRDQCKDLSNLEITSYGPPESDQIIALINPGDPHVG